MNSIRGDKLVFQVSFARPSAEGIKGANLYVSGLPKSMTQRELEKMFRPFGQIITSRILSDNVTGKICSVIEQEKKIVSQDSRRGSDLCASTSGRRLR